MGLGIWRRCCEGGLAGYADDWCNDGSRFSAKGLDLTLWPPAPPLDGAPGLTSIQGPIGLWWILIVFGSLCVGSLALMLAGYAIRRVAKSLVQREGEYPACVRYVLSGLRVVVLVFY